MTDTMKKVIISIAGVCVVFILIMTWFYSYSNFSMYKSYTYKPDPVMVDGYVQDLEKFKQLFEKDLKNSAADKYMDPVLNITRYILPLFEQEWLTSKEPAKMKKNDLDDFLFKVKRVRESLLNLMAREAYSKEQKQYLVDSIESLLYLEETIFNMKMATGNARKTLQRQFHNLHVDFMDGFTMYKVFFDSARDK